MGRKNQLQAQPRASPCLSTVITASSSSDSIREAREAPKGQKAQNRHRKRHKKDVPIPNATVVTRCRQQSAAQSKKKNKKPEIKELPSAEEALEMKSDQAGCIRSRRTIFLPGAFFYCATYSKGNKNWLNSNADFLFLWSCLISRWQKGI